MLNREQMIDEIVTKLTDDLCDDLVLGEEELRGVQDAFYDAQYSILSDLDDLALQLVYDELED